MARTIYNKDSGNLDGSTENVDRETKGRKSERLWHVSHGLDVSATVTFYGTHEADDDFSESIQIGSFSISSSGGQDYETLTDPWEQIRIEVSYASNPSSGNITIYENAER